MDPTQRWKDLLAGPEHALPLDEAALLIAVHAQPELQIPDELERLDLLAEQARMAVGRTTEGVLGVLFDDHGLALRGDTDTYDDPRNSYLDQVLRRHRGIPISLSVLVIEVGRRLGLRFEGIGMPGHFLVRDPADPNRLIDAFAGGRRVDPDGCGVILRRALGPQAVFDSSHLVPAGARAILTRMLTNLDRSFRARGDLGSLNWVTTLRAAIPGQPLVVRAEVASTLAELGRPAEALALTEDVLGDPDLPEAAATEIRRRAAATRARLN